MILTYQFYTCNGYVCIYVYLMYVLGYNCSYMLNYRSLQDFYKFIYCVVLVILSYVFFIATVYVISCLFCLVAGSVSSVFRVLN